jgi:hypothetical protein
LVQLTKSAVSGSFVSIPPNNFKVETGLGLKGLVLFSLGF